MKKLIFTLTLILLSFNLANANELYETTIDGYKIKALKVVKNSGYKIIVGVSEKGESLESMVNRYGGVSGVNGAYFCPADYKECGGVNKSWADRISNGYNWSTTPDDTGPERVIFAFDKAQTPFLFRKAHDYSRGSNEDFVAGKTLNNDKQTEIFNGIGNHPLLLQDGISKIGESGAIDNKMKAKSLKNFICSTKDGNTIYMGGVENITIYGIPDILIKLGCYNAINLDGGGSTAMIYNNKYIRGPGRNIMDAWIIIPDTNHSAKAVDNAEKTTNLVKNTINPVDSKIQKTLDAFRKILDKKFGIFDNTVRKSKLSVLSQKLEVLITKTSNLSSKKPIYIALKKEVDLRIEGTK
ncbi:phosphodiester glycosidase family protein [Candidatus Gracilibacteria bacterium]|nr:phosphodiester glycosidase family protein [Candidatus Gracilibacteria bacterium]